MKYTASLLAAFALAFTCATAQTRKYIPITIPVRDGKTLAADLYTSDTTIARPVILIQTPYNKNFYRRSVGLPPQAGGSPFPYDSAHYNYVTMDWRGRFGSKSAQVPGYDLGLDGYDAIEWIAAQPWCNGKVGTWGPSALGMIQYLTARHHPPHLVCCVPIVKDFKTKYSDYFYGGDLRLEHVTTLERLGFVSLDLVKSHPTKDLTWQFVESNSDFPEKFAVPMFVIGGWFDHFPDDVLRSFEDLRARSDAAVRDRHRLLFGPWTHSKVGKKEQGELVFPDADRYPDGEVLRFFDYYLRGVANGFDQTPYVRYYQMGVNEWRTTDDWPSMAKSADTLYLLSGGVLSASRPTAIAPPDTVVYDPRDPSPSHGAARFNPFDPSVKAGPLDIRDAVESRSDVLIFTTPVLTRDVEITGPVTVELFVSSNREDTDVAVRLCDVYPDGRSIILTDGIRRLRFRLSYRTGELLTPGQVYPVRVELQNLGMTFLKGHRIRVVISSSDYPRFDINLNNGDSLYTAGDTLVADNLFYHDSRLPSRVIFRTPGTPTSIRDADVPARAALLINYPNPFGPGSESGSPVTTITYEVPPASPGQSGRTRVRLDIYNTTGKLVRTLAEGTVRPGRHSVAFNGGNLPRGLYFVHLRTPSGTVVRKLLYQK